jgi:hypothetical protein
VISFLARQLSPSPAPRSEAHDAKCCGAGKEHDRENDERHSERTTPGLIKSSRSRQPAHPQRSAPDALRGVDLRNWARALNSSGTPQGMRSHDPMRYWCSLFGSYVPNRSILLPKSGAAAYRLASVDGEALSGLPL